MKITDLVSVLPTNPKQKIKIRSTSSIKRLIIHTTDWDIEPRELALYDIAPNHISSSGCPSITYHFHIGKSGEVSRTADPTWVTWHAGGHNSDSLSICLAYKTDPAYETGKALVAPANRLPTMAQLNSLAELIVQLCIEFKIPPANVLGHRELIGTGFIFLKGHKALRKTCPGMSIDLNDLRTVLTKTLQENMKAKGLYLGTIDGKWGPKSEAAFKSLK